MIYCDKQTVKHCSILVKYSLENNMCQIQIFNEMDFVEILNVLAAIDQITHNKKYIVLSNCYHRDDVMVQYDQLLSPCLYQTQVLSDPRMTHDSFEKKLVDMIQVACTASIDEKGLTPKAELR
jgi:hypothetical protein